MYGCNEGCRHCMVVMGLEGSNKGCMAWFDVVCNAVLVCISGMALHEMGRTNATFVEWHIDEINVRYKRIQRCIPDCDAQPNLSSARHNLPGDRLRYSLIFLQMYNS